MNYINKDRGQTNVDYIVSIGLFFTTLVIVISASSFLLVPDIQSNENKVISHSVSEKLTHDKLVHPTESKYNLSKTCTVRFFESMQTNSIPTHTPDWCNINSTSINEELLIDSERTVAIKIMDSDQNTVTLDGVNLQVDSDSIPNQGNVQTSQKYIYIEDNQYILKVYTW